jgi:hypothetical protein
MKLINKNGINIILTILVHQFLKNLEKLLLLKEINFK